MTTETTSSKAGRWASGAVMDEQLIAMLVDRLVATDCS